jgi:hypothetical protein
MDSNVGDQTGKNTEKVWGILAGIGKRNMYRFWLGNLKGRPRNIRQDVLKWITGK